MADLLTLSVNLDAVVPRYVCRRVCRRICQHVSSGKLASKRDNLFAPNSALVARDKELHFSAHRMPHQIPFHFGTCQTIVQTIDTAAIVA